MNYTSTAAAAAAAATTLVQFSSAQSVYWERDFRSKKSIVSDVPLFCFFVFFVFFSVCRFRLITLIMYYGIVFYRRPV